MGKLVGDNTIGADALLFMRNQGGTWAAYQNVDLSSRQIGHIRCLKYGPGCTFLDAPKPRLPDSKLGPGWQYYYVGTVDLENGKIIEEEEHHADQSTKG